MSIFCAKAPSLDKPQIKFQPKELFRRRRLKLYCAACSRILLLRIRRTNCKNNIQSQRGQKELVLSTHSPWRPPVLSIFSCLTPLPDLPCSHREDDYFYSAIFLWSLFKAEPIIGLDIKYYLFEGLIHFQSSQWFLSLEHLCLCDSLTITCNLGTAWQSHKRDRGINGDQTLCFLLLLLWATCRFSGNSRPIAVGCSWAHQGFMFMCDIIGYSKNSQAI